MSQFGLLTFTLIGNRVMPFFGSRELGCSRTPQILDFPTPDSSRIISEGDYLPSIRSTQYRRAV